MLGLVQGKVGEPLTFEGYADDYDKAIVAMEFSLDGGTTWTRHATKAHRRAGCFPGRSSTRRKSPAAIS